MSWTIYNIVQSTIDNATIYVPDTTLKARCKDRCALMFMYDTTTAVYSSYYSEPPVDSKTKYFFLVYTPYYNLIYMFPCTIHGGSILNRT